MYLREHASLQGINSAMAAIIQFETQIVKKLINNCENWVGLTNTNIKILQDIQDTFIRQVLAAPLSGTSKDMVELD